MAKISQNMRVCENGHRYSKSSDCPTCPICEAAKEMPGDLPKLPAPARRALENEGISSLFQLSKYKESEISDLHGMGPNALRILQAALASKGLSFNEIKNDR